MTRKTPTLMTGFFSPAAGSGSEHDTLGQHEHRSTRVAHRWRCRRIAPRFLLVRMPVGNRTFRISNLSAGCDVPVSAIHRPHHRPSGPHDAAMNGGRAAAPPLRGALAGQKPRTPRQAGVLVHGTSGARHGVEQVKQLALDHVARCRLSSRMAVVMEHEEQPASVWSRPRTFRHCRVS